MEIRSEELLQMIGERDVEIRMLRRALQAHRCAPEPCGADCCAPSASEDAEP